MTAFLLAATLLLILVLAVLLPPLLRAQRPKSGADRKEANLAVFRDQLNELENEYRESSLSETDFTQAKNELQRRLLDETQADAPPGANKAERLTALALLIALPLAAGAGYLILGNPQALAPQPEQASVSAQQIDGMLNQLAEKLKKNPDDRKGWLMLARSYKVLGRYAEAVEAYRQGGELLDSDAALLADYAEALARANGDRLEGEPTKLIARALKIDPAEPQALFLAGAAAADRKDFAAAAGYWEQLLMQVEPGSEEANSLQKAIDQTRKSAEQRDQAPTSKP